MRRPEKYLVLVMSVVQTEHVSGSHFNSRVADLIGGAFGQSLRRPFLESTTRVGLGFVVSAIVLSIFRAVKSSNVCRSVWLLLCNKSHFSQCVQ